MAQGIGIEIDEDRLVVAVVEQQGDRLVLSKLFHLGCDSAPKESLGEHFKDRLMEFFASHKLDRAGAVVSVPAHRAILRQFSVPFHEREHIDKVIDYETEVHIPAYPIEDLIVDYHPLKIEGEHTRLLVAAVPKKILGETIAWIESCDIYPIAVDMDFMGLLHTARANGVQGKGIIILDICREVCNVLVLDQGEIIDTRSIRLRHSGTEEMLIHAGEIAMPPPAMQDGFRRTEIMSLGPNARIFLRLIREVQRSLFLAHELSEVWLCGEPEIIGFLSTFLEKKLKMPVRTWDISSGLSILSTIDPKILPMAPVAVGMAIKSLGKTNLGYDFRRKAFRYQKNFDIMKKPATVAMTLLTVLFLLSGYCLSRSNHESQLAYDRLIEQGEDLNTRVNPESSLDEFSRWDKIGELKAYVLAQLSEAQNPLPAIDDCMMRWLGLFREIEQVRGKYYFTVEDVSINQRETLLEGRAEDIACFDLLKKNLQKLPGVDRGDDGIRLLQSQLVKDPEEPRLTLEYKFQIRFQREGE